MESLREERAARQLTETQQMSLVLSGPEELRSFAAEQARIWGAVVRENNIKGDDAAGAEAHGSHLRQFRHVDRARIGELVGRRAVALHWTRILVVDDHVDVALHALQRAHAADHTILPMAPAICGLASNVANCVIIALSPVICTSTRSPLALR